MRGSLGVGKKNEKKPRLEWDRYIDTLFSNIIAAKDWVNSPIWNFTITADHERKRRIGTGLTST